jgi:hypothetical protein
MKSRLISVAIVLMTTGCSTLREIRDQETLTDALDTYTYEHDLASLWPRIRDTLFADAVDAGLLQGAFWAGNDRFIAILEDRSSESPKNYAVHLTRKASRGTQVAVFSVRPRGADESFTEFSRSVALRFPAGRRLQLVQLYLGADRQTNMEWRLLRAVDPVAAFRLQPLAQPEPF